MSADDPDDLDPTPLPKAMLESDGDDDLDSDPEPAPVAVVAAPRRRNVFARMWSGWVWFWNRREDAAATSLVRMALALVILFDQFQIWLHDLVVPLYAIAPAGFADDYKGWAFKYFGPHTPHMAYVLWGAVVITALCILTGTLTRLACAAYVVVASQLAYIAPQGDRGIDMMIRIFIGILVFSRCNARWSVDAWVRRVILKRPIPTLVPAWPRYLLAAQLVWIYFSGGINKSGAEWGPFGGFLALANTLTDPHFARFSPDLIPALLPLTRFATAVTVTYEITAPIFLFFYFCSDARPQHGRLGRLSNYLNQHHVRWLWMLIGSSFHVGIAIFMRLGIFPFGMLALYPALLLPDELGRLGAFIRGRILRRQPPSSR